MNATCTIARERAAAAPGIPGEILARAADKSRTPCPRISGRATARKKSGSSETGKAGNIVSAEQESRISSARAPAKRPAELARVWANIMPENQPVRDSKSPQRGRIQKIAPRPVRRKYPSRAELAPAGKGQLSPHANHSPVAAEFTATTPRATRSTTSSEKHLGQRFTQSNPISACGLTTPYPGRLSAWRSGRSNFRTSLRIQPNGRYCSLVKNQMSTILRQVAHKVVAKNGLLP